ncbi:MAG: choice-of-anchor Q domain-containing protein [Chloroflexota bacterium]
MFLGALMMGTTNIAGAAEQRTAVSTTSTALDTTFDTDGIQTTDFGGTDEAHDIVLQADGSIIVVGTNSNKLAMVRYSSTGALDTSFDGDGKLTDTALGTGRDVALQDDGHIVVVGSTNSLNFGASRYEADGSADDSFGSSGHVTTDMGGFDQAYGVAIDRYNKIVVVGSNGDFALVRYKSDGEIDDSFGDDGKQTTNFKGSDTAFDVAISDTSYDIIVVGQARDAIGTGTDFAIARYSSSGNLDSDFDSDGKQTLDSGRDDRWDSVALQSDDKIVVAGTNGADFVVARYTSDGSLDTSFDSDGIQTIDFGGVDEARDVVVQPNRKILLVGHTDGDTLSLARLNTDGSLDTTFGTNGLLLLQIDNNDTEGFGLTLQDDDKIVVAGQSNDNFAVARFDNPCTMPATIGDQTTYDEAIACFNTKRTTGSYTISLTADVQLTEQPLTIDNPTADVDLLLQGNDFELDGQEIDGVRPLTIAADTDIVVQNLTIKDGRPKSNTGCYSSCGGGIRSKGNLWLKNSVVEGNFATEGGGVYNDGGSLTIEYSSVSNNSSEYIAGVWNQNGASAIIMDSLIVSNESTETGSIGGVYNSSDSTMMIINSTIGQNVGDSTGGVSNSGDVTIMGSTISGNEGGIAFATGGSAGTAVVKNSTISGNVAGTAVSNTGNITLTHVTIANNHNAAGTGGNGFVHNGDEAYLYNSLFADNGGSDCVARATIAEQAYNLVEADSANSPCATADTIVGTDPGLGLLQNNGGDSETQAIDKTSIAYDAVPVVGGSCDETGIMADQRGVMRAQGAACDIGAYEYWGVKITAVSDTDASLSWGEAASSCTYNVHVHTSPYEPPQSAAYTDFDVDDVLKDYMGNASTSYYSVMEAVCNNVMMSYSNEVGAFTFDIVPGS